MLRRALEEKYALKIGEIRTTTAVICSISTDTILDFEKQCLKPHCTFSKPIINLGYTYYDIPSEYKEELNESIAVNHRIDAYALITTFDETPIESIEPLISNDKSEIKWTFLLDWTELHQGTWLRFLSKQFESLESKGYDLKNENISVWCMNSDYMFELQKNDILWESFHFEYLQQSLRSVLLYRNGSLIYVDKKRNQLPLFEIFVKLCLHNRNDKYKSLNQFTEMSETSQVFIPFNSDSEDLIKTIDEEFQPEEVLKPDFMPTFEKVIPYSKPKDEPHLPPIGELPHFDMNKELEEAAIILKQASKKEAYAKQNI